MAFRILSCRSCGLRFPFSADTPPPDVCPVCKSQDLASGDSFTRHTIPHVLPGKRVPAVSAVLDNIRSAWNVGAIFRTADAAGVQHLYLCGITPTPENAKVCKTSLGSEKSVSWSYHPNGLALVRALADRGERLWALEGGAKAEPIRSAPAVDAVTWVIGNENAGIDPGLLAECERVLYLPMTGNKESLNVVIAFGVAAYYSGYFQEN